MDYLTVLSTSSVTLFSPLTTPYPRHQAEPPDQADIPLSPIDMPIQSLIYDTNQSFYFLLHRLLTLPLPPPLRTHTTVGALGAVQPETTKRAEIVVWEEIDKAKAFAQALGRWFESHERVTIEEMDEMAQQFGLKVPGATGNVQVRIPPGTGSERQEKKVTTPRLQPILGHQVPPSLPSSLPSAHSPFDGEHVDNQLSRLSHLSVGSINSDALEVIAA